MVYIPVAESIFKNRSFGILWLGQLVSIFGDFVAIFAVISRITFQLHGTPLDVSLVMVAYMLPLAVAGPVAGVLVDRWKVRRVMIVSDLTRAVLAALLVTATDVRQISVVMALLGLLSSFFGPAQSVALRVLVPPANLLAANQALQQAFYVVRIFSPAVAGALVTWMGENFCFWLDAASFVFSASMIARLVIERPATHLGSVEERALPATGGARTRGALEKLSHDFAEGNRFIFSHRALSFAFLAASAAMFMLSSFSPLISIYIRDTLHAGKLLYGFISAMVGVGLIVGTAGVRRAAAGRPMSSVIVAGLFGLACGAALLGAFQWTGTAALSTLTIGAAIGFIVVPATTLSQKETPPAMQGRVSSTFMSLFSLAQVLGMLVSGVVAARIGIRPMFLACAAATALLASASWVFLRPPRPAQPEPAA